MRSTSVLIADRHPVVLRGLSSVLGAHPDFRIVACCSDGASCIEALRNFAPDIAILDVSMPDVTFLDILSVVNSEILSTRLVVFTASDRELGLLMAAAADGYSVIPVGGYCRHHHYSRQHLVSKVRSRRMRWRR
jgi:two-component system nitrate/nitrite response regulator NarL